MGWKVQDVSFSESNLYIYNLLPNAHERTQVEWLNCEKNLDACEEIKRQINKTIKKLISGHSSMLSDSGHGSKKHSIKYSCE